MSIAIVDARDWQNLFDLRSGEKIQDNSPATSMMKKILSSHPYPGDMAADSNRWVTDAALDLAESYDPDFIFLIYSGHYYSSRFNCPDEAVRENHIDEVFSEVERFAEKSGFFTVVAGTGDLIPISGYIDLTGLNGLALCSHWFTRYAGLYNIDMNDMAYLEKTCGIECISGKEDFLSLFRDAPGNTERLPDYLAVSSEGYCFRSAMLRIPRMVPSSNTFIPISGDKCNIDSITGISGYIESSLKKKKTALILLEGIGENGFRFPFKRCRNGKGWYSYESGSTQTLTISTGVHQAVAYPAGNKAYEDEENNEYPFSGYFKSMPENTIGKRFTGRSIAVGNRSMFMHTLTGTDMAIECFSRNLSNQGCLGVIHRYRE